MGTVFITGVERYDAPDGERSLAVTGTAAGVSRLRVLVRCGRAAENAAVPVLPSGDWSVYLPAAELWRLAAERGATVRVHAESIDDPECWDSWAGRIGAAAGRHPSLADATVVRIVPAEGGGEGEDLRSTTTEEAMAEQRTTSPGGDTSAGRGNAPDDCPHINFAPVEVGERGDDGGHTVRLEATVALPGEGTLVARIRDSRTGEVLATESADGGSVTLRDEREWGEGEHTVAVEVLAPEGCPRVSSTFRVEADADADAGDDDDRDRDRDRRRGGEEDRARERSRPRAREDGGDRDPPRDADRDRQRTDGERDEAHRQPDVRIEVVAPTGVNAAGRGVRDHRADGAEPARGPGRGRTLDGERDPGREYDHGRGFGGERDHLRGRDLDRGGDFDRDRDTGVADGRDWQPPERGGDDYRPRRPHHGRRGERSRNGPGRDARRSAPRGRGHDGEGRVREMRDPAPPREGDRDSRRAPACPRIRFDRPEFGDGGEDGRRRVRLCARVELGEERRVVARLRDCDSDRVLATESSDSGRLTLQGRCDYDEGEHSVAVEILSPEECPEVATTFRVPSGEDDDDERLRRIKQGRKHREDEDDEKQAKQGKRKGDDDGDEDDDRGKWVGMVWVVALAAFLVIMAIESGFLASMLAFGIAAAVMGMTAGVSLLASGPARWAAWTYAGIALAVIAGILLLALTEMVSVGGMLLAAGITAVGFAIGAAVVSVYGKRTAQSEMDRREQERERDRRYRDRETEP